MRHGLGVLRWSPRDFWSATPRELYAAVEGWQESHGVDAEKEETAQPLTMDEFEDLMERFPDG